MEMELLDNGAIRCIVGQSDLEKHNLTMLDFVIHPESSRSMLQEFINLARIRYGFCPAGNTLIEAVPLAKDRLVLTFSNGQPPFFSDMMRDSDIPETDEDEYDDADAEDSRDDAGTSQGNGCDSFGSPIGRAEFGRPGAVSKRSRRHASREPEIYRNTRLLMSCNDILGADGTAPATPVSEESEEVVICFRKLDNLMAFADITASLRLSSTLFYGAIDRCYVLRLDPADSDAKDLRYAGNLADEYGTRIFDYSLPYYREYFSCIAEDDALEKLRSVR
ncbi:MAG: adaptor protein MecA [Lachnospiraceae bacterium]|nr:adaptor protein MecA [Lachnospiraceae bacterium]